MGKILEFRAGSVRSEPRAGRCPAEVVIFPGVRVQQWTPGKDDGTGRGPVVQQIGTTQALQEGEC